MVLRTTDSNKEPQLQKTKKMYIAFILDKGDYGLLRLQRKESNRPKNMRNIVVILTR